MLRDRARFLDPYEVPQARCVVLIVALPALRAAQCPPVDWMLSPVLDEDDHRLLHLGTDDPPDPGLSICPHWRYSSTSATSSRSRIRVLMRAICRRTRF